jgi:hypothetical protein
VPKNEITIVVKVCFVGTADINDRTSNDRFGGFVARSYKYWFRIKAMTSASSKQTVVIFVYIGVFCGALGHKAPW